MPTFEDLSDHHLRTFERPPLPDAADISSVFLIGICGTGMGALAGLLQQAGYHVAGSDEAAYPPMSTRLAEMDIPVYEGFDSDHLDDSYDLIVVGNICTPRHPEATRAREDRRPQCSLAEAVSHFFLKDRRSLVVAGTHGKTTTTGMLVHLLRAASLDPGYLIGGILKNTNDSYALGSGSHFVIEGDEYDSAYFDKQPKFMRYQPDAAIITSMEFDHADIYDSWESYQVAFRNFVGLLPPEGLLVLNGDDPAVRSLASHTRARVRYFGVGDGNHHVTASKLQITPDGIEFKLVVNEKPVASICLPLGGRHNLMNALAATTVALEEGVTPADVAGGFRTFEGLKRRQEIYCDVNGVLVVDDFAHHPTAVRKTVQAATERWTKRRLIAVFEPRSNSSRRRTFENAYGSAFDGAERVFLCAPSARDVDAGHELMDPDRVVRAIQERGIRASSHSNADEILDSLLNVVAPGDLVLIMSNGGFGNIQERLLAGLSS